MMISDTFLNLTGEWQGINRLWLNPSEPVRESGITAVLQAVGNQQFLQLQYKWSFEAQPQEGVLLIGQNSQGSSAVWVDSWHMQDQMMQLTGEAQADGSLQVAGSYAAPPGPDWGWRIALIPNTNTQWTLQMYNITPDGQAFLSVEAELTQPE